MQFFEHSYLIFHVTIVFVITVPLDYLVDPACAPLPDSKQTTISIEADSCYHDQFTSPGILQLDTGTLCKPTACVYLLW